jgi:phosphonate transport system ATP-binding protein
MPGATHISLRGVGKVWGTKRTLGQIDLDIAPSDRIALIGPSGGGKSTLIRIIAGSLRASEGSVCVDGQELKSLSWKHLQQFRARCRIVEQQSLLIPQASVHHNVLAGLLPQWRWYQALKASLTKTEIEKVSSVLNQLGIASFQWSRAGDLSGGQMQRVAIARALISEPQLLLADEPTASLDPNTARSVTQEIVRVAHQRHVSLVFCTHWFEIVRDECTRVVGLRDGRVAFDCPPADVDDFLLKRLYEGSHERH